MMTSKKVKKVIFLSVFIVLLTVLTIFTCVKLIPFLFSLNVESNRVKFENYVKNLGIFGILIVLLIQILQVFIAIIPGEFVELLAGFLYGTWGGLLLCLIGNFIGSLLIYLTVKIFANKYMLKLKEKLRLYSFLNNKKKISLYLFIIFLIPGLPKDIFTYLVPFLP